MSLTTEVSAPVHLTPNTTSNTQGRITSIDALRGFDMFWIIGGDALFYALNKMAGTNPLVRGLADQLDHVPWAGLHFYDCIFPLFVFIVGVSIVFSLSKRTALVGRGAAVRQIFRRFVILYLFGLFTYEGIEKGYEHIRLLGVLQRIALCYLFAALAFLYIKPRGLIALCATLLIGYWALMTFVPVPGVGAGNFEAGKNLANYVDREYLPLRKWDGDYDPEGLLSTLPAIGTCLLGIFAGLLLRRQDLSDSQKVTRLAAWGAAGIVVGLFWSIQFPIIKKIWTSSFVLVAGGISAILLALFYQVIDVWKKQSWAAPFLWIGTNAIAVYMLGHVVPLENLAERIVGGEIMGSLNKASKGLGDLLAATVALALAILFCRFLYKRRIFLKV
ncbi:MAG TPA: heparan-alpha-glucosaminide N-acetyltransferase domain-containing protein [Verrucomicrobiae bacterium]|jgi:predicted acyltransferase|nr:heparan-alpha-glucosaminide N-acetyltransferase domain-containing protein [Verrucomicrobiae bacterium]